MAPPVQPTGPHEITLREFHSLDDYEQCKALQRATWGQEFTECVPSTILMISQKVGGIAGGAFDGNGRLIGFIFGLTGIRDGQAAHWSHMLAVREEAQGSGLGRRLKEYQRHLLLERGVEVAYWTYDPLESRNANLNFNRLGAIPIEYVPEMYGGDTGSDLHSGLGTDRFIVRWDLNHPRVDQSLTDSRVLPQPEFSKVPVVNTNSEGEPLPAETALPAHESVRIEIPGDIQRVKSVSMESANAWRRTTRTAFLWYLEKGYQVQGFHLDKGNRGFYLLGCE
jgi:predicted GNAT superfamily acetyltransferase